MTIYNNVKSDFDTMLSKGIIPVIEEELNNGEYCVVNISLDKRGVLFEIDIDNLEELDIRFSGNVEKVQYGIFRIRFDSCFNNLQYYLEEIMQEINEGLLAPNDLLGE